MRGRSLVTNRSPWDNDQTVQKYSNHIICRSSPSSPSVPIHPVFSCGIQHPIHYCGRRGEARRHHGCEYTFFSPPPRSPKELAEAGGHELDTESPFSSCSYKRGYNLCYIVPLIIILYLSPPSAMGVVTAWGAEFW